MYLQNILNFIKIFFVISDYENLIFSFSDFFFIHQCSGWLSDIRG
ncbi:hypothetical protein BHF72_1850 [Cloacibacterium normanense]|uniref:Uncharacterized protein n=1 Tax=Cloacibacterium normanense TaxID=237258 RepID=A0A1E5UFP1_9FLAO|nr:hypothetical protein BHF72_1850 [Cloacibacterium normanense]